MERLNLTLLSIFLTHFVSIFQAVGTVNEAYGAGPSTDGPGEAEIQSGYTPITDYPDYTDSTELVPTESSYEEITQ